jgi:aspartate kinase
MLEVAEREAKVLALDVGAGGVSVDRDIARVTVVGIGMKTESGIAARMFRILADRDINIQMISTSPIRISCVVAGEKVVEAVQALHAGLGLEEEDA